MIFRYPGGKKKLLKNIMPSIDKMLVNQHEFHDVFIGGGSVLIAVARAYPTISLFANDKDLMMFSFWSIITSTDNDAKRLCELVEQPATIERFMALREQEPSDTIGRAYCAIFFNRTTFSGIYRSGPIGGYAQLGEWKVDCRYNPAGIISGFWSLRRLLSDRLTVSSINGERYIRSVGDVPLYADPPYYHKGNILYNVGMSPAEHVALATSLKSKSQWVLSYDDCDEIRDIYSWAEISTIRARYSIDGNKDSWKGRTELVIAPKPAKHQAETFRDFFWNFGQ